MLTLFLGFVVFIVILWIVIMLVWPDEDDPARSYHPPDEDTIDNWKRRP